MTFLSRALPCMFRSSRAVAVAAAALALACSGDSTSPNGAVASVTLSPDTGSVPVGASMTLHATVTGANGAPVNGQQVFWNTGNAAVATVSDAGVVTGVGTGQVQIAASAAGKSGIATITVLPPPVAVVVVTTAADTLVPNGTVHLTATLLDVGGHPLTGRVLTWTSAQPDIARIDDTGVVTGVAPGTAAITAASEGKTGTSSIVVVLPPAASITVTPTLKALAIGETVTLTAVARDSSNAIIVGAPVSWTSSNESVATVSATGQVAAVGAGIATITAQSGPATAAATIVVGSVLVP